MNDQATLRTVLSRVLNDLDYSDKLTVQAISDLEQVIAIRYYNKLVSLLSPASVEGISEGDYQAVILLVKQNIDGDTLKDYLVEIVEEVVGEYVDALGI